MMNHVTSAHGSSPECSDSSDLDSSGEDELGLEDDKKSRRKKSRSSSSAAQKYKMHGKMSELKYHTMFLTNVRHYRELIVQICYKSSAVFVSLAPLQK